jgi:hypothetical protein
LIFFQKQIDHPIQIEPHSRIDTWRKETEKPISSFSKSVHQPMHVQARSKIDTWTSETQSKTVHSHRMVCIQYLWKYPNVIA